MEFITQGNRIAVENFDKGKLYTVLWKNDTQKNLMCISIGADCVVFQGEAPINLFTLSMRNADTIDSIEPTQLGTTNYNNLINKPQINGVDLIGNKTGTQLGLVSQLDLEDYATNASVVAGLATKQDALSSSQLTAVNSGITSELVTQIGTNTSAIAGKQDALSSSQLSAVNSGITSELVTQIGTNTSAIAGKQDALSSSQLSAVNSGITSTLVTQIGTNENNILSIQNVINNTSAPSYDSFEQGWVDISTGNPTANTNRCRTLKTFLKSGDTIRIIANGMYYNIATWTGETYNGIVSNSWIQDNGRDIMFPDDRYIVIGVRKADNTDITPSSVVAIIIRNVDTIDSNILYGENIIFDGDSICSAGSEGNAPYNGYAYRIGHGNSMTWHNVGAGGATIATETYFQDLSPRHWLSSYIDTIHLNYPILDYLILEGGVNDADILGNNGIGSLDVNDYSGTYDTTTFTGALDTLFYKAINYYPTAKIGFIIAQKMGVSTDYTPTDNIRRKFFERAMDVCKKWGISYINLWDNSPLNPKIPVYYNSSLDEQGNRDGGYAYTDGQHLTGTGYDIITPIIEAWLRTL